MAALSDYERKEESDFKAVKSIIESKYNAKVTRAPERSVFDVFDAIITDQNGRDVIAEIKSREKYGFYDFNDILVDKSKIERLKGTGKKSVVIALYPKDRKLCVWDISKEYETVRRLCNINTMRSRTEKRIKDMFVLPFSECEAIIDY